jgi:hypothetical protein
MLDTMRGTRRVTPEAARVEVETVQALPSAANRWSVGHLRAQVSPPRVGRGLPASQNERPARKVSAAVAPGSLIPSAMGASLRRECAADGWSRQAVARRSACLALPRPISDGDHARSTFRASWWPLRVALPLFAGNEQGYCLVDSTGPCFVGLSCIDVVDVEALQAIRQCVEEPASTLLRSRLEYRRAWALRQG